MNKISLACKKLKFVDPYDTNNKYEDDPIPKPMCCKEIE